jgi:hypothetical protein
VGIDDVLAFQGFDPGRELRDLLLELAALLLDVGDVVGLFLESI